MANLSAVQIMGAPAPLGPYSPAIRSGAFLFCSGQVGLDPATGKPVPGGTVAELRKALSQVDALLKAAGLSSGAVVRCTLFLTDMGDFKAVNAAYAEFFPGSPKPARSCVAVAALPAGARVEIEVLAAFPD